MVRFQPFCALGDSNKLPPLCLLKAYSTIPLFVRSPGQIVILTGSPGSSPVEEPVEARMPSKVKVPSFGNRPVQISLPDCGIVFPAPTEAAVVLTTGEGGPMFVTSGAGAGCSGCMEAEGAGGTSCEDIAL